MSSIRTIAGEPMSVVLDFASTVGRRSDGRRSQLTFRIMDLSFGFRRQL
jgi:hypothetical protein